MRFRRPVIQAGVVGYGLFLIAAVACAGPNQSPTSAPAPTADPSPTSHAPANPDTVNLDAVYLPGDEGIHLAAAEWWYFNGHLDGSDGNQYSFHFVTFVTVTGDGQIPQLWS